MRVMATPFDVRDDAGNALRELRDVQEWARTYMTLRPVPDFRVGPEDDPQLQRWFVVPRNPFANVYLHRFLRSDDDRALHDHPWDNRSWIISGEYLEHLADGTTVTRHEGELTDWRPAIAAHRVELVTGPVTTLFFTGPIVRSWGFYCPQGWRHWRQFVTTTPGGNQRGRGCE
jgi:hypothetical protein